MPIKKKAEAEQPPVKKGDTPGLPTHFEGKRLYEVVVIRQFSLNRFQIRPGRAKLRGDVAQKYRDYLQSAWLSDEEGPPPEQPAP